jgi:glycosyltransferase involved in cell wall biosynthesis
VKLLVDCFPFLLRSAGVKTALYEWVRALRAAEGNHQVACFPWLPLPDTIHHQQSVLPRAGTFSRMAFVHGYNKTPGWLRNALTPRADLFHISMHLWHAPTRLPITTTIHDMTCWTVPETHTPQNVKANREFAERVYPRARGLLAVSDASKADACRILNLPEDRVETIHNGIAHRFFDVPRAEGERVREALKLPDQYVLYVGTIEPRKNLARLLNAWESLPADLQVAWKLVIAGPIGWAEASTVQRLRHSPMVQYLGYVDERDLPGLFRAASLLAYPSLYEGFGLPPAQALASGVPVLTSNTSSLPEVCGEGALYVDPLSELEIATGLRFLLEDAEVRQRLGEAGRQHVAQFTWENAAAKSLRFFERIL